MDIVSDGKEVMKVRSRGENMEFNRNDTRNAILGGIRLLLSLAVIAGIKICGQFLFIQVQACDGFIGVPTVSEAADKIINCVNRHPRGKSPSVLFSEAVKSGSSIIGGHAASGQELDQHEVDQLNAYLQVLATETEKVSGLLPRSPIAEDLKA